MDTMMDMKRLGCRRDAAGVAAAPARRNPSGLHVFRMLAFVAVAALAGGMAAPARAQSYSADDVIKHFAPPGLGKKKAVCFGTDDECKDAEPASRTSADMTPMDLVVTFDNDSDALRPEAKRNLQEFAKALKSPQLAPLKFEVGGHTDGRGSEEYNKALSERRAAAVVRFLATQGIPAERLTAKGFGRSQPRTADPMDPANRRVETRPFG